MSYRFFTLSCDLELDAARAKELVGELVGHKVGAAEVAGWLEDRCVYVSDPVAEGDDTLRVEDFDNYGYPKAWDSIKAIEGCLVEGSSFVVESEDFDLVASVVLGGRLFEVPVDPRVIAAVARNEVARRWEAARTEFVTDAPHREGPRIDDDRKMYLGPHRYAGPGDGERQGDAR